MHNLAPPPLATPKSSAVSGGFRTHRSTTSRLPEGGEGDRGGPTRVLSSLPESRSCPGVQNEGWRRTGRRRAQGPRAHNLTHAPHTRRASAPARSSSRLLAAGRSPVAWASAPGRRGERSGARPVAVRPACLAPADPSREKPPAPCAPRSHPKSPRRARGRPAASGRPGLDPNLPGAASAAAAAGGRAAAAAAAAGQARLGPGGAQRGRRERLRFGSCSAPTGAGVTALRRRCSLAPPPGRSSLARRPVACSPGRPPPLAFLMSTDSEKELGVRG